MWSFIISHGVMWSIIIRVTWHESRWSIIIRHGWMNPNWSMSIRGMWDEPMRNSMRVPVMSRVRRSWRLRSRSRSIFKT